MIRFTSADGQRLMYSGIPHKKKPNPVYLHKMVIAFEVETREGVVQGEAGDYVAYDPLTGDVWPIKPDYKERHYLPI